jgi:transposase
VKISPRQWLWAVKLFELEMSAVTAGKEIGISYPTVIKAFDVIRGAIAGPPLGVFPSTRGAVAGTDEVAISCSVDRWSAARTLQTVHAEKIKCIIELRRGCMICADGDVTCSLLIYRNRELKLVHRGDRFPRFRIYFDGMEGFWPYAKERFAKYHGISDEKLPYYMNEMEFRYDHRDTQLFDLLVERLCRPMPRSAGEPPTSGDPVLQSP